MVARNNIDGVKVEEGISTTVDTRTYRSPGRDSGRVTPWYNRPDDWRIPSRGWPTEAPPGTEEKLEILTLRHKRHEELFHDYDARYDGDIRPLLYMLMKHEEQENRRMGKKCES